MYNTLILPALNIRNLKITFYLKILRLLGFALAAFLVSFCVFQINAYTRSYFSIQSIQADVDQLTKENRNLSISFSNINSLNNIDEHITNFEGINKIEYVKILDKTVLAK